MNKEYLISLEQKYGSPLYVYDAEKIISQYRRLENAFGGVNNLKINYATKALSNISILKLIKSLNGNLDCVSIQEVQLGLEAGFRPDQLCFTPSGVSMTELDHAVSLGAKITLDSLSVLEEFGSKYPNIPVSIRINPHIMAGGNKKISVGHVSSKFGISKEHMPDVLDIIEKTGTRIDGVHMHTGSDILDIDVFVRGAEVLFEIARNFDDLDFIDFGGGFKVAYKEEDPSTDIEEFGKIMTDRFNEFCKDYGKDLAIEFEPGKLLVSECGYFLAKVNVVKPNTNTIFAGIDSGLNHLLRPMYYDAYHHIDNISNPLGDEKKYTVVGYICETDTFAKHRPITEIRQGDVLSFKNAGAYCFSMASNYNSRCRPAEVMVYKNKDYLIRERETFDDLLKHQIEINLDL
jgi:diaminopimelate decarboxylase